MELVVMKKIERMGAQGDGLFIRIDEIPAHAKPVPPVNGRHVVLHSETGHHHYLAATGVEFFADPTDSLVCYLRIAGEGADVVHARPFDTHKTLGLAGGSWSVKRQREYTPEGLRRVED